MTDNPSATSNRPPFSGHPMRAIRSLDYTILFARDMAGMRRFYSEIMRFEVFSVFLGENWIEYRVGANILALCKPGGVIPDGTLPIGTASVQLAFRVLRAEVDAAEALLRAEDIPIVSPAKDQPWGHRTLFFRDPDGNLLEIYAEI